MATNIVLKCPLCGGQHHSPGRELVNGCTQCGTKGIHWGATKIKTNPATGEKTASGFRMFLADGTQHHCTARSIDGMVPKGQEQQQQSRRQQQQQPQQAAPVDDQKVAELDKRLYNLEHVRLDTLETLLKEISAKADGLASTADLAEAKKTQAEIEARFKALEAARPLDIKLPNMQPVSVGRQHRMFANLVAITLATKGTGIPFLQGEAGSFKSSAALPLAEALGNIRHMLFTGGPMTTEIDIFGYRDANGQPVDPWGFADFYENGGLTFWDEIDNTSPQGLTAINSMTVNTMANFASGQKARHQDWYFVAAGNTFGRGADAQYVGRSQLDAATLTRFVYIPWDTDWEFVGDIVGMTIPGDAHPYQEPGKPADEKDLKEWGKYVKAIHDAVEKHGLRAVVSSRAVLNGAKMLATGIDRKLVEDSLIWLHMSEDQRATVRSELGMTV